MRAAGIAAFALLQGAAMALSAADSVPTPAPFDKTCFELPVVIVSPTGERLPTETCNQQRFPAIDCMKKTVEVHIEVIDHSNGTLNCLNGERTAVYPADAHYRGQSSLHFSKHQMTVKLHEVDDFLGFPADKKFVLNGPVIDSSLMRNHLAHWLFRGTTRYSPRTRHIVVFVRDNLDPSNFEPSYKGIYLALEKISYGPNRVGLAPLDNTCRDEELNGGWAWQNNPLNYGVYSPNIVQDKYQLAFGSGERPVLMAPKSNVMTQTMRDYFVDTKTGPLPRMYQYLYDDMMNSDGLGNVIDIGSFVDYFLHSEMSQNSDAYRRSTYFFKDRDQPINAGPVWDFNLAYGRGNNQKDWLYKPHMFWRRLFCNYKFASLVPKRWRELRATAWSDIAIQDFLGNNSAPIKRQLVNCNNWSSMNLQCANTNGAGTYESNVDSLERSVLTRARWMDENVAGFYMKLNNSVCFPAGDLPQYNCAADGNDDGCLTDPEKYISAVEFPSVRKPSSRKVCAAAVDGATNDSLEKPSIDPCWLSAGTYIKDGSLTPFCSGYGSCPPGPGATCKCTQGRKLPTCARSDDPIGAPMIPNATVMQASSLSSGTFSANENRSRGFTTIVISSGILAVCVMFAHQRYRRRQQRVNRQTALLYPPVGVATSSSATPTGLAASGLQYGT
uniref:EGF-like domain-containing protein n=1 Tax=Globisporangium ultimum (strain ATCC 200006 / CBS 805.95 / DAOM BR144) TaxID=431595 RepID=K3X2P0_GLOUD